MLPDVSLRSKPHSKTGQVLILQGKISVTAQILARLMKFGNLNDLAQSRVCFQDSIKL